MNSGLGSGRGPFDSTIPTFAWTVHGQPRTTSVKVMKRGQIHVSLSPAILMRDLLRGSVKR
jgi:hypothetical protein